MPVILTQSDLFARSAIIPASVLEPLQAHISGPQAGLHRYATAAEKTLISLGSYNPNTDADYDYPDKADDSLVDLNYVKLFADSAQLKYFEDLIGSDDTVAPVSNHPNRIRAAATSFKANGASYPRSSSIEADVQVNDVVYIRGVVSATNIELTTFVQGFVAEVVAASVASSVADAANKSTQSASSSSSQTAGASNCVVIDALDHTDYDGLKDGNITETYDVEVTQGSVGGDATTATLKVTSTSGNDNVASVTPAAFGSATDIGTRGLTATWANTVSGGCSGQDFVVGQKWRIVVNQDYTNAGAGTSAGTYTGVGSAEDTTYIIEVTRGGFFTKVLQVDAPAAAPNVSTLTTGGTVPDDDYFVVVTYVGGTSGETTASAESNVTTSGGGTSTITVQSPADADGATQYKVYVSTTSGSGYKLQGTATNLGTPVTLTTYNGAGTAYSATNTSLGIQPNPVMPQITVTTSTGIDLSGPTTLSVSGSKVTWALVAANIGTKGITWLPSGTSASAVVKGDKYRVTATAQKEGAYKTLVLGHNLPTTPVDMTTATDLDLKLYVKKSGLEITKNRLESPPDVNWVAAADTFTTKSGITATDSRWTAGTKYPVTSATLYLEYREWLQDLIDTVGSISDPDNIETAIGTVTPDNPLAYGVYKALQNSNGQPVNYSSVSDPDDTDAWGKVLELIDTLPNMYGLVPLTDNADVHTAFFNHVKAQSSEEVGSYRNLWLPLTAITSKVVVDVTKTSDGQTALATLIDNPSVTGTQYTYLQVPAGNAKFITNAVAVGDIVRYLYTTDGFGNASWTEFTVASVVNEDTLILKTGHSVAVTSPQKVEVWHNNTKDEIVTDLIDQANGFSHKLVQVIWPDELVDGSTTFDGMFAGAMYAGLASAVPPHQGLTNVQVLGATDVPRTTSFLNYSQRKRLAEGGVWVIEKDPATALLYCRAATTTDVSTIENREEMIVRDINASLYAILAQLAKYVGTSNIVDSTINQMRADAKSVEGFLKQRTNVNRIGSMINSINISDVRQHTTLKDRLVITLSLDTPFPVNKVVLSVVM